MNVANLGPIAEDALYGACRPGHLGGGVEDWAGLLRSAGVTDVVCLLSTGEASRWGLPDAYDDAFATAHVPIRDRHLPSPDRLRTAMAAVERAVARGGRAAVHCNAGLGRTGIVGAAWLVYAEGRSPRAAVDAVETGPARRTPREAIRDGNATEAELFDLLERIA